VGKEKTQWVELWIDLQGLPILIDRCRIIPFLCQGLPLSGQDLGTGLPNAASLLFGLTMAATSKGGDNQ
jgi:hypothetical protein